MKKEEIPFHKKMSVEDMRNIKYNRLVFDKKAKNKNVKEKFTNFTKRHMS